MRMLATLTGCALGACTPDFGLLQYGAAAEPDASTLDAPPGVTVVEVPGGDIDRNTTWRKSSIYVLKGYVFVTNGTLTIEPGTKIIAENGSALTITRDGQIDAVGTRTEPIVFTSALPTPKSGDWGGVVLLGRASINVTGGENSVEGFASSYGDRIRYGVLSPGTPDDTHDCGKLRYVRIEYAGFALAVDRELNGLTVGGCGSQTEIDYVQVHLGSDDGVEMFGGTANLRHILITQPDDDGLDWDFGWSGKAQFVIVQQASGRGDRGYESDNNPNNNDATPRSAPTIWNTTLIGGDGSSANKKQGGYHLRRGTAGAISNGIVAYWNQYAFDVDGRASRAQVLAGTLLIQHHYFVTSTSATSPWPAMFDWTTDYDHDSDPTTPAQKVENDCDGSPAIPGTTNCFSEEVTIGGDTTNHIDVDVMLTDPKNTAAPNFQPQAGSPVLTGCGTPPTDGFFDTAATYCGAIGTSDWTDDWTAYPL